MLVWTSLHKFSRRTYDRLHQERGQALVEFAVVLPVLILIILGIIYFGRYEDYSNQMTQLAELGARQAAVNNNPSSTQNLQAYIQSQAQPELQAGSSDVTGAAQIYIYYPSGASNTVGSQVRVCVVATVKYPFFGVGGTSSTMDQSATMRIEQADTTSWLSSNNPGGVTTPPSSTNCPLT
jgi:filamentous hemagglutinin family protein